MAVDMFLKIGDIEGESTDDKHGKEIDVLAWSWGMSQSGTTHMAAVAGRQGQRPGPVVHQVRGCVDARADQGLLRRQALSRKRKLTVRKAGKDAAGVHQAHDEGGASSPSSQHRRQRRRGPADRERHAELRGVQARVHAAKAGRHGRSAKEAAWNIAGNVASVGATRRRRAVPWIVISRTSRRWPRRHVPQGRGAEVGAIKGESQDSAHKDEIDVVGWSWGMRAQTEMAGGGAPARPRCASSCASRWTVPPRR